MRRKPPPKVVATLVVVDLILAWFTFRDLKRRDESQVRGSKRLWKTLTLLNPGNSIAYWLFGRKPLVEQTD